MQQAFADHDMSFLATSPEYVEHVATSKQPYLIVLLGLCWYKTDKAVRRPREPAPVDPRHYLSIPPPLLVLCEDYGSI